MARKKLTVYRKGHKRKSFIKDVKRGRGVKLKRIPATRVKPARFKIEDVGAVGRGKKVIPVTAKTSLTKHGYRTGKSKRERMKALSKADRAYGSRRVFAKLRAMETMRSPVVKGTKRVRTPAQLKAYRIFKSDRIDFAEKYLSPTERRAMTAPAVRVRWKGQLRSVVE